MHTFILNRRYWFIPLYLWTLLVLGSMLWNLNEAGEHSDYVVHERAHIIFDMIRSMRVWSAKHGGIYTLGDDKFSPEHNPELDDGNIPPLPDDYLTLVNPSDTPTQLADNIHGHSKVLIHITSLKPLNTGNAPEPWEAAALERFAQNKDITEFSEFHGEGDRREYRFIAPLVTKQSCMRCHEQQGYKVGDIRGGVSITFPPGPLLVSEIEQEHHFEIIHIGIWLLVTLLIFFGLARHRRQLLQIQVLITKQDSLVEKRTAQLQEEVFEREAAEERLSRFIEASAEGMLVIDHKLRCTLSNPAALRILGYRDKSQIQGRSIHDFLCSHNRTGAKISKANCDVCKIHRALKHAKLLYDDELHFRHADGTHLPVEVRSSPIVVEGHTLGSVITFADISERKYRELELRKLTRAVEHSPASVMITDPSGRIEYVNRKFSETSGYSIDEVLGQTPSLMRSGRNSPETYQSLWQHIRSGQDWRGELLNRKKNGALFWEEIAITPINDEDGHIRNFVAVKEDISERKEREALAWRLANFDSLTGLMNRHCLLGHLGQQVSEAMRYGRRFALLFIDLDGFKAINDTLGHDAGDDLLKEAAKRLQQGVRDSDMVARLGGDEFTIIIPDIQSFEAVNVLVEKIIQKLGEEFAVKGRKVNVSASIGIAAYPEHGNDSDSLLNHADAAMYQAKANGKNTYRWHRE